MQRFKIVGDVVVREVRLSFGVATWATVIASARPLIFPAFVADFTFVMIFEDAGLTRAVGLKVRKLIQFHQV